MAIFVLTTTTTTTTTMTTQPITLPLAHARGVISVYGEVFVTHSFPFSPLLKEGKVGEGERRGIKMYTHVIEDNFLVTHRHSSDASLYPPSESTTIATISCFQRPSLLEHPQVSLQFGYLLLVLVCLASSV